MVLFPKTQQRLEFESCLGKRLASIFFVFMCPALFLYKRVMHLGVACDSKGFGFVRLVGAQTPHMHPELQHPPVLQPSEVEAERRADRSSRKRRGLRALVKRSLGFSVEFFL